MTLVEFVPPTPHPLWKLCLQMGITDVIVKVNPSLTGLPDPWRLETLKGIVDRLAAAGLRVVALEGDPFDMSPIKEFGATGEGRAAARPEALDHYCELLESMGTLGIRLLCYNFMVGTGWARTGVREGRGGARATYFSLRETLGGSRCCATADAQERVPPATFTVIAKNLSKENKYVKSVTLNGKPLVGRGVLDAPILRHADIMRGGELVFEMTGSR